MNTTHKYMKNFIIIIISTLLIGLFFYIAFEIKDKLVSNNNANEPLSSSLQNTQTILPLYVEIRADKQGPFKIGEKVTFTAITSGFNEFEVEYLFQESVGDTYSPLCEYSPVNSITWKATKLGEIGLFVSVRIKNSDDLEDAVGGITLYIKDSKGNNYIPPDDIHFVQDVVYRNINGRELKMDVASLKKAPSAKMPAIILIHGGGWMVGSNEEVRSALSDIAHSGFVAIGIEYTFSYIEKFPAQLDDCKTAVRFVRANAERFNIDTDAIGVWGTSAGGHLSSLLGTTGDVDEFNHRGEWQQYSSKVQAVCNCSGPSDLNAMGDNIKMLLENLIGKKISAGKAELEYCSPISYISPADPPFLLIHGLKDDIVPYSQSENFYSILKSSGVDAELKLCDNMGHELQYTTYFKDIIAFFESNLKH